VEECGSSFTLALGTRKGNEVPDMERNDNNQEDDDWDIVLSSHHFGSPWGG
jgi:hypothetical protein